LLIFIFPFFPFNEFLNDNHLFSVTGFKNKLVFFMLIIKCL
jgi:hypothetical protein